MSRKILNNPHKVLPQIAVGMIGSGGYFCMGAVRAWSSPALPSLNRTEHIHVGEGDLKWISSVPLLTSLSGALLVSIPMQYFGRKKTLLAHYLLFALGFFVIAFADMLSHKIPIYVGRGLAGIASGFTTPASQIYLSECASPRIRGRLGSLTASFLALGILMTYIVGAWVEWHVLAWVSGGLPLLFLSLTLLIPESPTWLLSRNYDKEARESLQYLRGKNTDIDAELHRMKETVDQAKGQRNSIQPKDLLTRPVLQPLAISAVIMLFQQTTGINAIVFYTVGIFEATGSRLSGRYATIIVGFVQLVFTLVSGLLVDLYGRRLLLMVSGLFSAMSLTGIGVFFHLQRHWGEQEAAENVGWLPLVCLIVFFVAYSTGMSNVPFIIMGEMFPARFRTFLGSIVSCLNLLFSFIVVRSFPDMVSVLGRDGTFYSFAICSLASMAFVHFCLPETKGKSLEEIEALFTGSQDDRHVSSRTRMSSVISVDRPLRSGDITPGNFVGEYRSSLDLRLSAQVRGRSDIEDMPS